MYIKLNMYVRTVPTPTSIEYYAESCLLGVGPVLQPGKLQQLADLSNFLTCQKNSIRMGAQD